MIKRLKLLLAHGLFTKIDTKLFLGLFDKSMSSLDVWTLEDYRLSLEELNSEAPVSFTLRLTISGTRNQHFARYTKISLTERRCSLL